VIFRGIAVSSGVAQGPAYVLACAKRASAPRRTIAPAGAAGELARFEAALARAEAELQALKQAVSERIGASEADIFTAQVLVLGSGTFRDQVTAIVRDKQVNAEAAVADVIETFTRTFDAIPDAYLRERAADIRDVGRRVLAALIDGGTDSIDIPEGVIVVSDELLPSVTARLELNRVRAIVTERGGRFSHTSILARSLGMPAIAGVGEASRKVKTGDHLIVDGVSGVLFINPDQRMQDEYARLEADMQAHKRELGALIDQPAVTLDGTTISLQANVSKFPETEVAFMYKADGIGLYRTEFGYSVRSGFPTEDEQYEFLERAAERFHPRRVVFRLLDIGGDKELPYFPLPQARNPSLAQRGIRLLLAHPQILKTQLRAFLRVSAEHPVAVLLPVVGGVEEVRETRAVLREAQDELAARGQRFNPAIPVGAMIEVPSAALIASALAKEVDFFSLGTNDLVQYLLAADREDESIAPYYQPLHPAVLRLVHDLAGTAHAAGRALTICGEMAGNPAYTELLLGLGLRELSVAPNKLLDIKQAIRATDLAQARALAARALELGTVAEIEALVEGRNSATPRAV
jgi:phosphotransferase system enzyme I (PtsI)